MIRRLSVVAILAAVPILAQSGGFGWKIPTPFPRPVVPADNPMSAAKVELGRYLFYDRQMSSNGKTSCTSCHRQEFAFTDGRAQAEGTTGEVHPRSSMSLANVGYSPVLTWANPSLSSLEEQAKVPMFGTQPIELGLSGYEAEFLRKIRGDEVYQKLFPQAFPQEKELYTITNVTKALAAFERTIVSMNSPYDRYRYGNDPNAISDSAKRGEILFFSEKTGCFQCHGSWNFNGPLRYEGGPSVHGVFQNTGLYNVRGEFSYPAPNTGLYQYTNRREDVGKFRVPTLRNIAVTAPYMHDGSIATLSEVIDHYAAGGRTISSGPYAGIGHDNPNKALNVRGFKLSDADKNDLIAFLESLTDKEFLNDPSLSDPWKR
jgi:cytochrome c peroxidase